MFLYHDVMCPFLVVGDECVAVFIASKITRAKLSERAFSISSPTALCSIPLRSQFLINAAVFNLQLKSYFLILAFYRGPFLLTLVICYLLRFYCSQRTINTRFIIIIIAIIIIISGCPPPQK